MSSAIHAKQTKTTSSNVTEVAKTSQKAHHAPTDLSRVPLWAKAWGDNLPPGLLAITDLQTKLAINQPGDIYEQEADRVAEQVTGISDASRQMQHTCACGGTAGPNGECEACKQKRQTMQRQTVSQTTPTSTPVPSIVHEVLHSPGQTLDADTQAFAQSRFGQDFSHVQIHTDAKASMSAQAVNALAYTVGNDIAFQAGQFAPGTTSGRRLLAHELTHVVQQTGGTSGPVPSIQRVPANDFLIRGKTDDPADINHIYFTRNNSTLDTVDLAKVPAIITSHGAGSHLTLNGFRSEDESATLANDRALAVSAELGTARAIPPTHPAHTGPRAVVPMPAPGVGNIDYRSVRKVEVLDTPVGLPAAPSAMPSSCATSVVPCPPVPNAFTLARPFAVTMVSTALTALAPASLAAAGGAATKDLLRTLFGGLSPSAATRLGTAMGHLPAIKTKLTNLKTHLVDMALPAHNQCHNLCDGGCGDRPAYNTDVGAASMMTLCPTFFDPSHTAVENAATLIHEGAHGTTGLATEDLAYETTRQIAFLTDTDAMHNTDSYVLLIRLINSPGSVSIGPAPADRDVVAGTTAAEERTAREAVAHLERWLLLADFDTQSLYDTVNRSLPPAPAWASGPGDAFNRETMGRIAAFFGLTNPGPVAPFTLPTPTDRGKIASIHDRFIQMRRVVYATPISISKIPVGADVWAAGVGIPGTGAGSSVSLTPAFFALPTPLARVRRLVELISAATPDISPAMVPNYVEAADQIRLHRGVGP